MHLQLTLIEQEAPLVADDLYAARSPWKREQRPLSGLLHGLYVFSVIYEVCGALNGKRKDSKLYGDVRRAQIREEVATIPEKPTGLSHVGVGLWDRCRISVLTPDE
jgi:HEXXH motif-containing protein